MKKKYIFGLFLVFNGLQLLGQQASDSEMTWEELAAQYECPDWFRDVKFGMWCHWGPQVVPESGGGWYARHMYMQDVGWEKWGKNAYPYHVKTYGHPSEFGFKDVINLWKAEKFDADSLLAFFRENGARYFVAMANHHDHFDNFASTHHPWNSVNMGPKRDIVGEFEQATRKRGLYFGITSHDDRHWEWWKVAFGSDKYGPMKGMQYDSHLTKSDGIGKWWEGYDPKDLYGPKPNKRTVKLEEEMKENWLKRHLELVNKYQPDLLYFDSHGFSGYPEQGREVARTLHANSLKKHGSIQTVLNIKNKFPGVVWDVERGGSLQLEDQPWQSEITFGDWFYKPDEPRRHDTYTVLQMLIDVVSKNGTFLLNVELAPDGTIPSTQRAIISYIGDWLKINGEAIYGTRPWKVYGDGSSFYDGKIQQEDNKKEVIANAMADAKKDVHFNERTIDAKPYAHDEVRFTTKDKNLYVIVLNPAAGPLAIRKLSYSNVDVQIQKIDLLNDNQAISFTQKEEELEIQIPELGIENKNPIVLKLRTTKQELSSDE